MQFDLKDMATFGVAGNFTGHLEQAGEARDFVAVKVTDAKAPKAIFPTYIPGHGGPAFLNVFPFDEDKIIFPAGEEKLQIEPECAIVCEVEWGEGDDGVHSNGGVLSEVAAESAGGGAHSNGTAPSKVALEPAGGGVHSNGTAPSEAALESAGGGAHSNGDAPSEVALEPSGGSAHSNGSAPSESALEPSVVTAHSNGTAPSESAPEASNGTAPSRLLRLTPVAFGASNDCSIRKDGAKKISEKKNWGAASKGFSSHLLPVDSFTAGGVLNRYRIASFLVRDGQVHPYGEDSAVRDYSYVYEKLLEWMLDKFNNQQNEGPAEHIIDYLRECGCPKQIMVSIGATRYTDFGEHNFLQDGDRSVVVLYPEDKYTAREIAAKVGEGNVQEKDISVLDQTVRM